MSLTQDQTENSNIHVSERELKHHMRYLGTSGFKNADGSPRVPTEQEVVDHGFEPVSYLTDPIPDAPRVGICGIGKTDIDLVLKRQAQSSKT
jgi:hypothetical protein